MVISMARKSWWKCVVDSVLHKWSVCVFPINAMRIRISEYLPNVKRQEKGYQGSSSNPNPKALKLKFWNNGHNDIWPQFTIHKLVKLKLDIDLWSHKYYLFVRWVDFRVCISENSYILSVKGNKHYSRMLFKRMSCSHKKKRLRGVCACS